MATTKKSTKQRITTPKTYNVFNDERSTEGSGKSPNYTAEKTPSGHNFVMDDSKGNESVTIQHRSGSAIQMRSDGSVHYTTHNGKYEVVFGEDRITVSGARDITVKGDASLRVYGDYNVTCHKNYNLTVIGDYNFTAKNLNRMVRGNIDTQAKNETKKLEGSSGTMAHGAIAQVAKGAATFVSHGDQVHVGGGAGANFHMPGEDGKMTIYNNKGPTHMENKDGPYDMKVSDGGQTVTMAAKEGSFHTQADKDVQTSAQQKIKVAAGSDMQLKSDGSAGLEGSTTHISGTDVHVKASSGDVHVDGNKVNLAMGAEQGSFDFGSMFSVSGIPSINSQMASQPTAEEDSDWTSKLV